MGNKIKHIYNCKYYNNEKDNCTFEMVRGDKNCEYSLKGIALKIQDKINELLKIVVKIEEKINDEY